MVVNNTNTFFHFRQLTFPVSPGAGWRVTEDGDPFGNYTHKKKNNKQTKSSKTAHFSVVNTKKQTNKQ